MAVSVNFGGQTYSIPEDGESGWENLTNYLVALSNSQLATTGKQAIRTATTSPVAVSAASDYCVVCNIGSAASVVLPSGSKGQLFVFVDGSLAARTNNITISTTGGQLINGVATYVLNQNGGAVGFQFDGTGWRVLFETPSVLKGPLSISQNTTNTSFVEAGIVASVAFASPTNLQSCSATFGGSKHLSFVVAAGGKSFSCDADYNSTVVNCTSDPDGIFQPTDSGTGIYVAKASGTGVVLFKNRMGASANVEVKALTNTLTAITAWS